MKGLNRVQLIGNLGGEPDLRYTPAGKAVTTMSLATSRKFKNDEGELVEHSDWHKVVTWGALAENCNKALSKGAAVFVSGRVSYRQYEDKDKQKHYVTEIIADDCIFLDKAKAGIEKALAAIGAERLPEGE